jgi:electron transfer flavoprotein alpha subunit
VLLPSTYVGRDLAPRVAGPARLGLTGDCIDLAIDEPGGSCSGKPAFRRQRVAPILSRTAPEMATVRPGRAAGRHGARGVAARIETLPLADCPASRLAMVDRIAIRPAARPPRSTRPRSRSASGSGSAGRGSRVIEAARRPRSATRRSRPRATSSTKGWLPRQHQVGITGRAIAPRFYFAIGIRGASEHMVGVARSERSS